MRVVSVQLTGVNSNLGLNKKDKTSVNEISRQGNIEGKYCVAPINYKYGANIHFGEYFDPNRKVANIEHSDYMAMYPSTKARLRRLYNNFNKTLIASEMFDPKDTRLPLQSERNIDKFIEISSIYSKYKDQPIICLGRSPKWFLNASLWMKEGINHYTFVAFSGYWHRPSPDGMRRMPMMAPTEKEEKVYRKYLHDIQADPKTIVDYMEKTGKKTVITDYICSGKGVCSFLEVMGKYADDLGILEKFSKSIQIVGIGSMDYMEELNRYDDEISIPRVQMPEILEPYYRNVEQTFYDMDYGVFREMLLNQNTNECRSTYYPHKMWTVYKPDKFKTGLINDPKKVKKIIQEAGGTNKNMAHFTPAMCDFRNLLNFHILDELNTRGLLKLVHNARI